MKRDTGRIEGLYYDPGSQPYQRLDLVPEGSRGGGKWAGLGARGGGDGDMGVNGMNMNMVGGGVRKWFPSVD